jgi:hypothetical protein
MSAGIVTTALGINLPWVTYGCDFGANRWQPAGGLGSRGVPDALRHALDEFRARGGSVVRWFLLCDGRAGVEFEDDRPVGLDAHVFADMEAALSIAAAAGVSVMFVLFDFHWCVPARTEHGVSLGGRRASIAKSALRRSLVERVACPIFQRFGADRRIAAWDLFNEPEWATWRYGARNPFRSVRPGAMRGFLTDLATAARLLVKQPITVGLASGKWLSLVDGLPLDFDQVHWYDRVEGGRLPRRVANVGLGRPIILGEFPTAGSAHAPEVIQTHAAEVGYGASWPWSLLAADGSTDRHAALAAIEQERHAGDRRLSDSESVNA